MDELVEKGLQNSPSSTLANGQAQSEETSLSIPSDRDVALSFFDFFYDRLTLNATYQKSGLLFPNKCSFTPDILFLRPGQEVFGLGDVHGDFDFLFLALKTAKLIDNDGKWIGGANVLIQLGDLLDGRRRSGEMVPNAHKHESKILNFLKKLHLEALEVGGMVITMLGNHDLGRLFTRYDEEGNPVLPDAHSGWFLKFGAHYNLGLDLSRPSPQNNHTWGYGHNLGDFVSPTNREDFEKGASLQNLLNLNDYNHETLGYHRQLLASCATKVLLKFSWIDEPDIGGLASHGEKHGTYLEKFFYELVRDLLTVVRNYRLNLPFISQLLTKPNAQIVLVNSLISFSLRYYQFQSAIETDLFAKAVFKMCERLSDYRQDSFIWCYLNSGSRNRSYTHICEENSLAQSYFELNPKFSINLSAHSGPQASGIIKTGTRGPCYNKHWRTTTRQGQFPTHQNTIIMTDVMGSRGFGPNTFSNYERAPQVVQISKQTFQKQTYLTAEVHHLLDKLHKDPELIHALKQVNQGNSLANEQRLRLATSSVHNYQAPSIKMLNNRENIRNNLQKLSSSRYLIDGTSDSESESESDSDSYLPTPTTVSQRPGTGPGTMLGPGTKSSPVLSSAILSPLPDIPLHQIKAFHHLDMDSDSQSQEKN